MIKFTRVNLDRHFRYSIYLCFVLKKTSHYSRYSNFKPISDSHSDTMSVNDHRTQPTDELFEIQAGPDDFSTTFIFGNEDHTLGNALRYVLMRQPETDFCGYSVPHPYEPKMNVRLQTTKELGKTSIQVLKKGLHDLESVCDILDDTFDDALRSYRDKATKQ